MTRRLVLLLLPLVLVASTGGCDTAGAPVERQVPSSASPAPSSPAAAMAERPEPAELLRNGRRPFAGVLTGGQPTPEQLAELGALGYTTVVNLRQPDEPDSTDPELVASLGMRFVALPVAGAEDVNEDNARRLAELLEATAPPVVVHCASGNRVGALFALKAYYVDGKSPEEALAIGRAAGVTRLESTVRAKLGLDEPEE